MFLPCAVCPFTPVTPLNPQSINHLGMSLESAPLITSILPGPNTSQAVTGAVCLVPLLQ
ncbi:rCG63332 [Rattus norvegicus]|uniref:RCG63332 n=1 Tax=Rattus norvegicus TaxID=10116 RepID=A6JQ65_RAT|nr:rCG63332 [Rattus norvegicus]